MAFRKKAQGLPGDEVAFPSLLEREPKAVFGHNDLTTDNAFYWKDAGKLHMGLLLGRNAAANRRGMAQARTVGVFAASGNPCVLGWKTNADVPGGNAETSGRKRGVGVAGSTGSRAA